MGRGSSIAYLEQPPPPDSSLFPSSIFIFIYAVIPAGKSWPSFEDDIEGRFRRTAKAIEASRGYNLPNARLASLSA